MAEVRFEHVDKSYSGKAKVIEDLNLQIRDHEFLVLVGPSGCGKSTILRMIAGLEEVTAGDLYIGDRLVNDVAPKDRDIAMVFQNYALYPHMSVYDNMAFALKLRHVRRRRSTRRVQPGGGDAGHRGIPAAQAARSCPAGSGSASRSVARWCVSHWSSCSTSHSPTWTPSCGCRRAPRSAGCTRRLRTTFVYVTHDQVEAMTHGRPHCRLNAGIIQQLGTPSELYNHPANLFVAGFIGSPAMNFFRREAGTPGRLSRSSDRGGGGWRVTRSRRPSHGVSGWSGDD